MDEIEIETAVQFVVIIKPRPLHGLIKIRYKLRRKQPTTCG